MSRTDAFLPSALSRAVRCANEIVALPAEDRSQEKLFKEWITNCHANLDKEIRFERPASEELQVSRCAGHVRRRRH